MRYGRTLLAGLGWVGTLGGLALCVLVFLAAYVAFDDDWPGVQPRQEAAVRLPSVPDAEVSRVPLARPSSRGAATRGEVGAVRQVSPPVGRIVQDTGDTLGDAVDTLTPRR